MSLILLSLSATAAESRLSRCQKPKCEPFFTASDDRVSFEGLSMNLGGTAVSLAGFEVDPVVLQALPESVQAELWEGHLLMQRCEAVRAAAPEDRCAYLQDYISTIDSLLGTLRPATAPSSQETCQRSGAVLVFEEDFEGSTPVATSPWREGGEGRFAGRLVPGEAVALSVPVERAGAHFLQLDLLLFDDWEGAGSAQPDRFTVTVNGQVLLSAPFSNTDRADNPVPPDRFGEDLGYSWLWPCPEGAACNDALYRDLTVGPYEAEAGEILEVRLAAEGVRLEADESWGVDNVRLFHVPMP